MDSDQSQQAPVTDDRPKILRIMTSWVGGLTGLVVAMAGLWAAVQTFVPKSSPEAPAANVATVADGEGSGDGAGASEAQEAVSQAETLPLIYDGDNGQVFDGTSGGWVATVNGEKREYTEQSRTDGETLVWDDKVYLRWPNEGGRVQSSEDGKSWVDANYKITPRAE